MLAIGLFFLVFFILILTYSKTSVRILILLFLLLEPLIKTLQIISVFLRQFLVQPLGYLVLCITLKLIIDLAKELQINMLKRNFRKKIIFVFYILLIHTNHLTIEGNELIIEKLMNLVNK